MADVRFWQSELKKIYPNKGMTPDYMMAHLYTACSDLARILLRTPRIGDSNSAVITAITWLIAIANHFDIDYRQAIIHNFPLSCKYCLSSPCQCDRTGKRAFRAHSRSVLSSIEVDEEIGHRVASITNAGTNITFNWIQSTLSDVYPSNRALIMKGGQSYIVGKMLEEGGELHREYSLLLQGKGEKRNIGEEIADLTAWIISCWDIENIGIDFEKELSGIYIAGCPVCKNKTCSCKSYSITLTQEEIIRQISSYLRNINISSDNDIIINRAAEIAEIAEAARANPMPKEKKSLARGLKSFVELLRGTEGGAAAVKEIVGDIEGLADHLEGIL